MKIAVDNQLSYEEERIMKMLAQKNDVAGNGARPDRVNRIWSSDDGIGAWIEAKGAPDGSRYPRQSGGTFDQRNFAVGEMIRAKLVSNPAMPFVWHVVDCEEKAREAYKQYSGIKT
jgi:hypothetical protein